MVFITSELLFIAGLNKIILYHFIAMTFMTGLSTAYSKICSGLKLWIRSIKMQIPMPKRPIFSEEPFLKPSVFTLLEKNILVMIILPQCMFYSKLIT